MNDSVSENKIGVKQTRFPMSIFWLLLVSMLLMSGLHIGLVVLMGRLQWNDIIQVHVTLLYWILVAAGTNLFVRNQIKKAYEIPLQKISQATKKIAQGDFSVYIEPTHSMDKLDYLDVMIFDINKMVEELGSIETLKTDFVSNVSHEMKTPVAVIKNSAQILKKSAHSEEDVLKYAETIEQASGRLAALITNILKLNRLENQKIRPQMEKYDVCRQLCDCIIQFEDRWEEKQIEMDIELEDRAVVLADRELMELVWNNLLSNAVKFTEPGGTITVKQTVCGDGVQIDVSDTGCGIREETLEHIFDKFYQGDTSHATEGNGLGLALVYRIMQLLDGEIRVESTPGKGSIFTVMLPSGTNRAGKQDSFESRM